MSEPSKFTLMLSNYNNRNNNNNNNDNNNNNNNNTITAVQYPNKLNKTIL